MSSMGSLDILEVTRNHLSSIFSVRILVWERERTVHDVTYVVPI
jgi:hypothetical protein